MSIKKSVLDWSFTAQARLKDFVTEVQLKLRGSLLTPREEQALSKNFDHTRIKIYWPSEYSWPIIHKWLSPLLNEFKRVYDVQTKKIPFYPKVVIFEIEVDGENYPIAIDRYDKTEIDQDCASNSFLYFKMQHSVAGYPFENVVPGGFIPAYSSIYLRLAELRKIRESQVFEHEVYGRFGAKFAKTIRSEATERLKAEKRFQYDGGIGRVRYQQSLVEVAKSKICIDLPGNGPLCFRLIDYLAVGSFIIAYPHDAILPVPLVDRKEIVYCKRDLSDLVELCSYYLDHVEEREAIAANARAYFDKHLARPRLAAYYIETVLKKLGKI